MRELFLEEKFEIADRSNEIVALIDYHNDTIIQNLKGFAALSPVDQ